MLKHTMTMITTFNIIKLRARYNNKHMNIFGYHDDISYTDPITVSKLKYEEPCLLCNMRSTEQVIITRHFYTNVFGSHTFDYTLQTLSCLRNFKLPGQPISFIFNEQTPKGITCRFDIIRTPSLKVYKNTLGK